MKKVIFLFVIFFLSFVFIDSCLAQTTDENEINKKAELARRMKERKEQEEGQEEEVNGRRTAARVSGCKSRNPAAFLHDDTMT